MTEIEPYEYVSYVKATPEQVWATLTDEDSTARFWGHRNVSTWAVGDPWEHVALDGTDRVDCVGRVLAAEPPHLLRLTFEAPDGQTWAASEVEFRIEPGDGIVRITMRHADLPSQADRDEVSHGWPAVMANLKTLLETGSPMPQAPWEMPRG